MPYSVGAKGSHGCSGYPAVKTSTGEVMGCHKTKEEAAAQIYAINRSEGNIKADVSTMGETADKPCSYDGCGCPTCEDMNVCCDLCPVCQANEMKSDCCGDVSKANPCWNGYVQRGMKEQNGKMVPNCIPAKKVWWEGSAFAKRGRDIRGIFRII